ncbi:MAG: PP2C family protein-serine/threonine phosphatase [Chloroflexota bacterium]
MTDTDQTRTIRKAFADIDDEVVAAINQMAERKTYPPGTVLCNEGAVEHVFYIVVDGTVAISQKLKDGGTRQLATNGAGAFFGEMALIENKPRAAQVATASETTVLEISEDDFNHLLRKNPSVAIAILRGISSTMRSSDQASIADLSRKNIELAKAYADLKAAQNELVEKGKLEHELEIAAELQQSLLPHSFPKITGWTFAGRNVPARTIGGDLFDVLNIDDDHLGLLMADVSDKSVHAALFMAVTRSLFLPEARRSLSPRDVALGVHRWLLEISAEANMFVTAFYGVLQPSTGKFRYIRAGQDRPLWVRSGQEGFVELDAEGRFLGMIEDLALEEKEVILTAGDTLVLYSDGVPDAVDGDEAAYGLERLVALLQTCRDSNAQKICDAIFDDVRTFRGSAPAFDDITVLVVKADA